MGGAEKHFGIAEGLGLGGGFVAWEGGGYRGDYWLLLKSRFLLIPQQSVGKQEVLFLFFIPRNCR